MFWKTLEKFLKNFRKIGMVALGTRAHRTKKGSYPPASPAARDEDEKQDMRQRRTSAARYVVSYQDSRLATYDTTEMLYIW